jgi:2-(1,2-epoxy-1,2-dihydrophenyl)acetyl-CoA isomerase
MPRGYPPRGCGSRGTMTAPSPRTRRLAATAARPGGMTGGAQDVGVDRDGHVAVMEIRRPPNNFFDVALIGAIADGLDELAADGCRAVVLASEGRHFCAGADFGGGRERGAAGGPHLYEMAIRLFEQPLPIVAAVQGAAIGGGFGLAMAADFRVAGPDARFAANFARLGFHHGFGLTVTLPLVVGHQVALDLLYTGRRIDAAEAHRLGVADRLTGPDDVRDQALALAGEIAASAPLAVRSIRETMRGHLAGEVRQALARERAEQDRLSATADWREGVAAMAERRPPVFKGE